MTRDQTIALAGTEAVERAETDNCEPTSRLYDHADGEIEWVGSAKYPGGGYVMVYYYTTAADAAIVEANGGDWGAADWTIDHYDVN